MARGNADTGDKKSSSLNLPRTSVDSETDLFTLNPEKYSIALSFIVRVSLLTGLRVLRVVAFVTQKGGSGKSTLAFCCGVRAEETGKRVLLLDMDPQATTEAWYQDREAERPKLARISGLI